MYAEGMEVTYAISTLLCLYIPFPSRSAGDSSTAWQFEPSMPTPHQSFGFVWLPATYDVHAIGGMLKHVESGC